MIKYLLLVMIMTIGVAFLIAPEFIKHETREIRYGERIVWYI